MSRKKAFTLIELMVVILIVSILAAVAVPIMRGRIDSAKWSEGKAMAGTLATSLRAYAAEKGGNAAWVNPDLAQLGFTIIPDGPRPVKGGGVIDVWKLWRNLWENRARRRIL